MKTNNGIFETIRRIVSFVFYQFDQARRITREYEVINTSYGKVRGVRRNNAYGMEDSYHAFEGIPYAKPPLRDLRFRAPQPPEPWDGVLNCTQFKYKPKQIDLYMSLKMGSEDCLYLNIYAKKLKSTSPLPVMVWIYGGGFQCGEATRDVYGPDYFMMRDVILVTFNYRLGVFGFLCLDDPDLNIPGNAGLKDQVLALQWLKENIHNFNGDPNNISVFGESAGAACIHMLMMSPQAKGLFHKAILQSGTALCPWSCTEQHDWGYRLACLLGFAGDNNDKEVDAYLVAQDANRLVVRQWSVLTKHDAMMNNLLFTFVPVIEPYTTNGCIANKPFKKLLPNAWGNEIPLIIGGNSAEGLFHYCAAKQSFNLIHELNELCCFRLLPEDVKRVHNINELEEMSRSLQTMYFSEPTAKLKNHLSQYLELMGHRSFWHPIYRAIKARIAYAPNVPTYCYFFEFDARAFNHARSILCSDTNARGACHGDDLSYLFRNVLSEKLSPSRREYQCIQRMVGMWYNFALSSNPNCKEIVPATWQPVQGDDQKPIECLSINDEVVFKQLPIYDKLQGWSDFYTRESLI